MMSNSSDLTGKMLGTCTLEKLIGRGGMGAVYLAQQVRPVRHVAVKVLLPTSLISSEVYQEFLARFQREANLIAQLEHVNIMPIYEFGEQDGQAYLVMPYLTGGSLRDLLARRNALSVPETMNYIEQAASALDYAHANGVIHRDLKPANFMLHADGRLVLADFGIARMMQDSGNTIGTTLTGTGIFLGTPEYMAPEMARGEHIDHRVDIYELGIVLYQMLSGDVPFKGNTPLVVAAMHMQEPLPPLHLVNPTLSAAVNAVVQQAAAKRREDRFMTAGTLAQALRIAINPLFTSSVSEVDERNAPTVLIAPRLPPVITPGYDKPLLDRSAPNPVSGSQRNEPSSGGFSPIQPALPITPSTTQRPTPATMQPWLIFVGMLLVLVLVVGGILIGLQINKGPGNNAPIGVLTATNPPAPTAHPTVGTTATPAITATSIPTALQTNGVPKGTALYSAPLPGSPCDKNGGGWVNYNSPVLLCHSTDVEISNPQANLVGTFLISLPNSGSVFPSNYVIEAQLQQTSSSHSDFGIYFRNQPGNLAGVYTFLIHPDGSWSSYVYDNTNGNPTMIGSGGTIGSAYSSMTVDVVVNSANFSFYVNGKHVGDATNEMYSIGTVGIVVDTGGDILASNFTLYMTAGL